MRLLLTVVGLLLVVFVTRAQQATAFENEKFYNQTSKTLLESENTTQFQSDLSYYQLPKKTVHQFAIDSPFGTLVGKPELADPSQSRPGAQHVVRKNYRLLLCFTGVGLRIGL